MVIALANAENENALDYLLQRMPVDELTTYMAKNSLSVDEMYHLLKRCDEQHLDWRTGKPISENVSSNRDAVYMLLDKEYKKINGEKTLVVCRTASNFLTILRNDEHFRNVKYNTLRGLPEKIINGKAVQWTDADDAISRTYIESCYFISNRQKYEDAFCEFQHEREYDPIQDRINAVEWDGVARVETMLPNRDLASLLGFGIAFPPALEYALLVKKQRSHAERSRQWKQKASPAAFRWSFTRKSQRKCGRRASQSVNSLSRSFMSITRKGNLPWLRLT